MREILFKAKSIDNSEWVKGYYCQLPKMSLGATIVANGEMCAEDVGDYIVEIKNKQHGNFSDGFPLEVVESEIYEVDSETLCQYTGIKDEDGNQIFENDIAQYIHLKYPELEYPRLEPISIKPTKYKGNYKVEFVNTKFTYGLRLRNKSIHFPITKSSIDNHGVKIIGNIFDNPELLEEL